MREPVASGQDDFKSEPQRKMMSSDTWIFDPAQDSEFDQIPASPSPRQLDAQRYHFLSQDPHTEPDHSLIWRYTPTDAQRLYADVMSVADLSTFVGRILLVITRGGDSKNFEELTGQDGLTFGITDFAGNEGCADFFRSFYENYRN